MRLMNVMKTIKTKNIKHNMTINEKLVQKWREKNTTCVLQKCYRMPLNVT